MADGLKLNLKEAIVLKNNRGLIWELKGKDSSGASFSWNSPTVFTVDVSYGQTVTLQIYGGPCRVDWGDGTVVTGASGTTVHTYAASTGTYDIHVSSSNSRRVDLSTISNNYSVVAIKGYYGNGYGSIARVGSNYLTSVPAILPPDITSLEGAFYRTSDSGAQFLNDPNISEWNTSNVTNMQATFHGCRDFNQPLSGWDTSKVTTMRSMFNTAQDFNQDISGWNVSNVTDMRSMFEDADVFNANISGWNVSKVSSASFMFNGANAFNQDISGWNTSSFTGSLERMFQSAYAFNQDISGWDVSGVTYMRGLFQAAFAFNQDITAWDTSNVTDMAAMFLFATSFNQDLGALKINSVTNMGSMLSFDSFYPTSMSTENYSRTLIGFANSHYAGNAQNNVPFGAATLTYNNTAYTTGNQFNDAVSARNYLVNTAGWTITDGGQV